MPSEIGRLVQQLKDVRIELAEVKRERDALRTDAERYRRLRKNPTFMGWDADYREDEVDKAVDAALGKEGA